jgi:hypothetical protein
MRRLLLMTSVAACLGFGTGANAAITVSVGSGPNFDAFNNDSIGSTSGVTRTLYGLDSWTAAGVEDKTVANVFMQPDGDSTNYVFASARRPVTLTSPSSLTTIDIYWGSIDSYNTLTLSNGDSITGADLASLFGLTFDSIGNSGQSKWVQITDSKPFNGFTASTSQAAFEFDMAGVPEASTWAMMLLGFAGLGYAGVRRVRSGAISALA